MFFNQGELFLLASYGYVGLITPVAIFFTLLVILIPTFLGYFGIIPWQLNTVKRSSDGYSLETTGRSWGQSSFHYYFHSLMFISLGVLVSLFIYTGAAELRRLGFAGIITVPIFGLIMATVGWALAGTLRQAANCPEYA